jgi:hypothetical protein
MQTPALLLRRTLHALTIVAAIATAVDLLFIGSSVAVAVLIGSARAMVLTLSFGISLALVFLLGAILN